MIRDRAEWRNIAIYLIKKSPGMTKRRIGRLFGDLSYSAVAKACQRSWVNVRRDKRLRKKVEAIRINLS